ncbi:carbonic anhydrase 4-like [Rhinophrynus dorsalis]
MKIHVHIRNSPKDLLELYAAAAGTSTWGSLGSCSGLRQSPIDIPVNDVQINSSLGALNFTGYSNKNLLLSLANPGHTVEVALDNGMLLSGGGLPSLYSAIAFHFHWGNGSSPGSEHRISGKQYPMEMHIVHTKAGMNLSQAKKDPSGIAVLAFFIDVGIPDNSSQLSNLSALLGQVSWPGTKLNLNSSFSVDSLLGGVDRTMFYRYFGSLTTPTCDEAVVWTVFRNPILVPAQVINAFSSSLHQNISGDIEPYINNFRPPQSLNARQVQASAASLLLSSISSTSMPKVTSISTVSTQQTIVSASLHSKAGILLFFITALLLVAQEVI